jgi:26S proteasome regulatory subunit N2
MSFALPHPSTRVQITECLAFAHETKHEKVIRGISIGVAMIAYGMEEAADALISQVGGAE